MFRSRSLAAALLVSVSLTSISGCTNESKDRMMKEAMNGGALQDRELDYSRDDFRKAMAPRAADGQADSMSNVPDLAPVISEDKKNVLPQPLVSITVNEDVPLRDIFYELAKQAEVDLELDPTITGSIIFTAYNRPFDQVVDRLCDMAGLRYTFKNNVLRVERDTPYLKTYHVGYVSMQRDYTSTITSNTSAASGSSGGGGGGSSNGSSSTVTTKNSTDFWNEMERNITQLIRNTNQQVSLTDQSVQVTTPNAIPAVPVNQLAAVNQPQGGGAQAPGMPGGAAATQVPPAAMAAAANAMSNGNSATPQAGLLNPTGTQNSAGSVNGAGGGMAGGAGGMTSSGGAGGGASGTMNPYFSVNRQAGLVNVFASQKQHRQVSTYIREMLRSINTQVLIEAKVFEVELHDEFSLGIDWRLIGEKLSGGVSLGAQPFPTNPLTPLTDLTTTAGSSGTGAILQYSSGDLNAVLNAISRFGTVRTLSSPRLSVMNNETAVLNVSESRVFFDLDLQRTEGTDNNPPRIDITSEVKNVPEGVIITVHPSVDPDTQQITMNLRPSITRVVRTVSDPAVALVAQQANLDIESRVPELSIREIDSMVKMKSGTAVIMGGLMQDRTESTNVSVPGLSALPIVGGLFTNKLDGVHKTEMVIILRATITGNPTPDATDKDMYENMSMDRHPIKM